MPCNFGIFNKKNVRREITPPKTIRNFTAWKSITIPSVPHTKSLQNSEHDEICDISIGCTSSELIDICNVSIGLTHANPCRKGTRSVTWNETVQVFEIPMRRTHIEPQWQRTRSVTWNEYVQVFYLPIKTMHVEPQQGWQDIRSATWYT
jgi:hypothetical protein